MKRRIGLVFLCLLLVACDDDEPGPTTAVLGGLTVRVHPRPARIEILAPDGRVLFDGLPGGRVGDGEPAHVALALRRAEATYEMQFGSFKIEETSADPWTGVAAFSNVVAAPTNVRFDLEDGDGNRVGEGVIDDAGDGEVTLTFTADEPTVNRMSAAFGCEAVEHFIGLGGQSFDVDHRGWTVPLWVQEDGITKAPYDEYGSDLWFTQGRRHSTHSPMPMMVSSRGYALLWETPVRSLVELCSVADDVARVETWEGVLRLRLFYGPTAKEAISRMTAYVGRPEVPPAFAFAPWLDAIYGSDNVRRVAQRLRDEGVPSSVIWTEDFRGGVDDAFGYALDEDWYVDPVMYPDFEDLADELHHQGFKFFTYYNTFIHVDVDIWEEADQNGYTIQTSDASTYFFVSGKFEDASLLDLTNPAARAWAKEVYKDSLRKGADGFMADFAEWLPTDAVLHSGEDAVRYHNLYPVEFQRLVREVIDEMFLEDGQERLFFARSGYLGSQPLMSIFWAGDQQTDFTEGDGMVSVIPMGLGLGVTGFPYYGHDIAGYMSQFTEFTTKELFFRWTSLGALSPVMRTHHGKSARENWSWESDAETIAHFRRWATLHLRLFPYLYGLAAEAADTGIPMMRPLALEYPDFEPGWTRVDQYLLGDRLLVAPIVEQGAQSRTVYLPEGTWYPLEGTDPVTMPAGGGSMEVSVPLTECPVYVPAGTVLVLLPEGVDTVAPTDATGIVTLDDVGDDRELWLWPGGNSQLSEADGVLTYDWQAASWDGTVASVTWNGDAVTVPDASVIVTGNGTLDVGGSATLVVAGGESARQLTVWFR